MYWEQKERMHLSSKSRMALGSIGRGSCQTLSTTKKVGYKLIPTEKRDPGGQGQKKGPTQSYSAWLNRGWGSGDELVFWWGCGLGVGRGQGREEPFWLLVGRGETGQLSHNPALSLRSLRQLSHLLRSAGNWHAPHYFNSQRSPDRLQISLPLPLAIHNPPSPTNPPQTPSPPPAKTTGLPVSIFFFFYTKTFLLISISDRQQNSGAQRSQVQGGGSGGRRATSACKTRLLKANQATLPPSHTHTHSNYFAYFDTILARKPFFSLLLRNQVFKKLALSLLPKEKKKNPHKVISQYFSNI